MASKENRATRHEGDLWAMLQLFKKRSQFRRLVLGNLVSQLGEWLSYIAVSLLTVSSGEGGIALATAYLAHTLPNALVAPLSGRVADRFDRRLIMLSTYAIASLITALMMMSAWRGQIWLLQGLTAVRTAVNSFGQTARQASVPSLVAPEELYTANALISLTWSTQFALGVAMGGVLAALFGPTSAIGIDAITFVIAIFTIWGLPSLRPQKESLPPLSTEREMGLSTQTKLNELDERSGLWAAWTAARLHPKLMAALLSKCPLGISNSAGWMVLTIHATLGSSSRGGLTLGAFHLMRAIGTGIGPLIFKSVWPKSAITSTLFSVFAIIGLLHSPSYWVSVVCLLSWGGLLGYTWVRSSATIQELAPSSVLGRLGAFELSCTTLSQGFSILFIGWMFDLGFGLAIPVYLMAIITLLTGGWLLRLEKF